MNDRKAILQAEIEKLEEQEREHLNADVPNDNKINAIRREKEQIQAELRQIENEENREQSQRDKIEEVDEMELPYDFNEIFENEGANDIIRELLKDQYQRLFDEHNEEIKVLRDEHRDQMEATLERERQLERQNDELQKSIKHVTEDRDLLFEKNTELHGDIDRLKADLHDAHLRNEEIQQNRANAARELEEARREIDRLNSHIDDLRNEIAVGAKAAVKVVDAKPTEKLNELVKKAKTLKEMSADEMVKRFEERQKEKEKAGGRYVVTPPEIGGTFRTEDTPSQSEGTDESDTDAVGEQLDSFRTDDTIEVPSVQPETESGDITDERASDTQLPAPTREEFEALKSRVDNIEKHAGISLAG